MKKALMVLTIRRIGSFFGRHNPIQECLYAFGEQKNAKAAPNNFNVFPPVGKIVF